MIAAPAVACQIPISTTLVRTIIRNHFYTYFQDCGSGLIQSGSGSRNLAQSGSTMSLNPDPIWIHNVIEYGSDPDPDTDPDPQQYFRRQIFPKIKKSTTKNRRY
jgi:hypothetical protein